MCECENIEIGSYDNQVILTAPNGKQYGIDRCISDELQTLWRLGITTTGCCCGHNKVGGYIGVIEQDIPRMKEMGYLVKLNSVRPNAEDSFIPKSVKFKPHDKTM